MARRRLRPDTKGFAAPSRHSDAVELPRALGIWNEAARVNGTGHRQITIDHDVAVELTVAVHDQREARALTRIGVDADDQRAVRIDEDVTHEILRGERDSGRPR